MTTRETDGAIAVTAPSVATVLSQVLRRHGCTHMFGLMGDGNMGFYGALDEVGIELVEVRHESAAVAMAEGYGWGSGRVGFCSVTHGPGLTHTATSLVVARRSNSPLVLIVAETPVGYTRAQEFDQETFVRACEAPYRSLRPGEDPERVLDEVVTMARVGARPVVLGVGSDLFAAPAPTDGTTFSQLEPPAQPTEEDNRAAADAIVAELCVAQRPVLLAGRGALADGVFQAMRSLADRFGAGLATTIPAKGMFDGHSADLGTAGGLAHPISSRLLGEADLVVSIGAGLNQDTIDPIREARMLQLINERPDKAASERIRCLFGDALATVRLLLDDRRVTGEQRAPWFGSVPTPAEAWAQDIVDYAPAVAPGRSDPRRALTAISAKIPEDAILVMGNGHNSGFVANFIEVPERGRCFAAHGFGSIGQCLQTAIGVALGAPGKKVVAFEGDASLMMHLAEIESASRAKADVTLFVLNDEALGTEYQRLALNGENAELAVVPTPDLAAVASMLGARGLRAEGLSGLDDILPEALAPGLAVVEMPIDRAVLSHHMRVRTHL